MHDSEVLCKHAADEELGNTLDSHSLPVINKSYKGTLCPVTRLKKDCVEEGEWSTQRFFFKCILW